MSGYVRRLRFALAVPVAMLSLSACGADGADDEEAGSSTSSLSSVVVTATPDEDGSDVFTATVSYWMSEQDSRNDSYDVVCTYPNVNGNSTTLELSTKPFSDQESFQFEITTPGTYTVSCRDDVSTVRSAEFTVGPSGTGDTTPATAETAATSFEVPKPGDFASAGMWMYFDQGTSSVDGYAVPQQCLPGVNYSQAGGTSSFDIDVAGNMAGACQLSYGPNWTLTGSMTGTWDGATDTITFHLVAATDMTAESNGATGSSHNETVFDGTAAFVSTVQASGTATWSTVCTTTDMDVILCGPRAPSMSADGTVPFVINFNPPA